MNKYKDTAVVLQDNLDDNRHSISFQSYSLVFDIISIIFPVGS